MNWVELKKIFISSFPSLCIFIGRATLCLLARISFSLFSQIGFESCAFTYVMICGKALNKSLILTPHTRRLDSNEARNLVNFSINNRIGYGLRQPLLSLKFVHIFSNNRIGYRLRQSDRNKIRCWISVWELSCINVIVEFNGFFFFFWKTIYWIKLEMLKNKLELLLLAWGLRQTQDVRKINYTLYKNLLPTNQLIGTRK